MRLSLPAPDEELLNRPHILVVDDDTRIRELLGRYLGKNGFLVTEAEQAATARQLVQLITFDAIVLDIMMPGEDGLSLTQAWKTADFKTPVLLLTAKGEAEARIAGLEAGADDYLAKPFEPRELVLRLNAILRRAAAAAAPQNQAISFDGWAYDATRTLLVKDGDTQILTKAEATLLNILSQNPGKIFHASASSRVGGVRGPGTHHRCPGHPVAPQNRTGRQKTALSTNHPWRRVFAACRLILSLCSAC